MVNASKIYKSIFDSAEQGKKQLAILLDPDKLHKESIFDCIQKASEAGVDYIFVGGSLMITTNFEDCLSEIKKITKTPIILFPGSPLQVSRRADAILLLSLISGRNPELLIGQHVIAAPMLKQSELDIIPTGYILIDSGKQTTASYISNTTPIPYDKPEVAACTAMAGEMLGLKLIYMDGGSGAMKAVSSEMINAVKKHIQIPLVVGGGIKTAEQAHTACNAGADVVVVGNAFENNSSLIKEISAAVHEAIA